MKSSELRIGNLFELSKGIFGLPETVKLNAYQIYNLSNKEEGAIVAEYYHYITPIPLTQDWLLKFGFILNPWGWVIKSNNDFGLTLSVKSFNYKVSGNNQVKVKHVHQLQNLYFALTGEELKIIG